MRKRWREWNRKQRVLLILIVIWPVAMVVRYSHIPLPELPTPARIHYQEKLLKKRQKELAELKTARAARNKTMAQLRAEAAPFWQIPGKVPEVEVQREFTQLLQKAQVQPTYTGSPREEPIQDFADVKQVTFQIRLTRVSMREVSRLLEQMSQARFPLAWQTCSIIPDNPKTPQSVNLNGQLRALVLSDKAAKFLNPQPKGGVK